MTDIVERIASRANDAPLPTEYLLDEAGAEIVRLRKALARIASETTEWDWHASDGDVAALKICLEMRRTAAAALSSTERSPTENIEGGA